MQAPTARARRTAVSLSSIEGRGEARKFLRVWEGKKMRAIMPGTFRSASMANAVWINEGMVEAVVEVR